MRLLADSGGQRGCVVLLMHSNRQLLAVAKIRALLKGHVLQSMSNLC